MSLEYKIVIIFLVVGLSNLILRGNRNWVLGYRSARALKSHARYSYANTIYGVGMMLAGAGYFVWLYYFPYSSNDYPGWQHAVFLILYFAILAFIIEYRLSRVFKA